MSYIRTKNGVYKIDEIKPYFLDEKQKLFINNELKIAVNEKQVIKQSESLEELCDEFVLHYGDTMQTSIPIPWATYERRDDNWQKHKEKLISELKKAERKATVYGAIWTSKGLIYVANMDSDGKLELI